MDKLYCRVNDPDRFSSELLKNFIEKTDNLCMVDNQEDMNAPDIIFIDSDLDKSSLAEKVFATSHIIIVSSNKKYITSFFKNQITDFLYKPDLNYARFLKSIEFVRNK